MILFVRKNNNSIDNVVCWGLVYDKLSDVAEIWVQWRSDFQSGLAFWKNICNIWDPVNTKIHIFPTFATINYFPRGAIVKVYKE